MDLEPVAKAELPGSCRVRAKDTALLLPADLGATWARERRLAVCPVFFAVSVEVLAPFSRAGSLAEEEVLFMVAS